MEEKIYMVTLGDLNSPVFIKELGFFIAQGGAEQSWGRSWFPVKATGIEEARKKGEEKLKRRQLEGRVKEEYLPPSEVAPARMGVSYVTASDYPFLPVVGAPVDPKNGEGKTHKPQTYMVTLGDLNSSVFVKDKQSYLAEGGDTQSWGRDWFPVEAIGIEDARKKGEEKLKNRKYYIDGQFRSLPPDKTIRELQSSLPWTGHYHRDFRSTPMTHKDFAHALLHVHKAGGKLAAIVNDAEHGGVDWANETVRKEVGKFVADFVVCALRMANTCPEGQIDLQKAVEDRITGKNNQLAEEAPSMKGMEKEKSQLTGLETEIRDLAGVAVRRIFAAQPEANVSHIVNGMSAEDRLTLAKTVLSEEKEAEKGK